MIRRSGASAITQEIGNVAAERTEGWGVVVAGSAPGREAGPRTGGLFARRCAGQIEGADRVRSRERCAVCAAGCFLDQEVAARQDRTGGQISPGPARGGHAEKLG